MLCIVETQIARTWVKSLVGTLGFDKSYAVDSNGRSGGLGIFWNNDIQVDVFGYSDYHISARILEPDQDDWWLSCMYDEGQMSEH